MPRDHGIEPPVERGLRIHGVQPDPMPQLAKPRESGDAFRRGEVVEDRLRHEEVRRRRARVRLELGHPKRGVQRQVDVVAEEQVAGLRWRVEGREAVSAGAGGGEELAVVVEREGAGHACPRTQWNVASASGSRIVTSSSRRRVNPASARRRRLVAAG